MAKISDNNIRIPSTDPLTPAFEELARDYQCLQASDQCPSGVTQAQAKQKFIDTYSATVSTLLPQMNFPVSDGQTYYSVSDSDPSQKKTAKQICENNAAVLLDSALTLATNQGPAQVDQLLLIVHDYVYWAHRAGSSDNEITTKLAEIQSTLVQELPPPQENPILDPPKVTTHVPVPIVFPMTIVGSVAPKPALQLLDATLSISAVGGKNSLQEVPEVPDLKTNYQMMQLVAGVRFHIGTDQSPVLIQNSGPLLETGISLVAGSPENLGSHRTELDLRAGWRQALFSLPLANEGTFDTAIKATTGLGAAFNALSFGNGYIDPHTNSLMTSSQVFLDTGYCWPNSRICTDLSGGFFYEKTLLGLPNYQNMGALFGLTFTNDINLPHQQH